MGNVCSANKGEADNEPGVKVVEKKPVEAEQPVKEEINEEDVVKHKSDEGDKSADEKEESEAEDDSDFGSDIEDYVDYDKTINPYNIDNPEELEDGFGVKAKSKDEMAGDDLFACEEAEEGEKFMAIKPWKGAIVEPSNAPKNNAEAPDQDVILDWVHGYRCHDSRNNIAVNSEGNIVYPAAGIIVKYDKENHKQEYYHGHNDDIICLAQNPANKDIVASGQVATIQNRKACLPHICVWNSKTNEEWVIKRAHKRAVRAVGFSTDGKLLASIGNDNNYTVKIWDWENKQKLAAESGDVNPHKIFQLVWKNDHEFVTVGVKHIYFWTYKDGELKKKRGKLGKFKRQTFFSATFTAKGYCAVGARGGDIYIFVNDKCAKVFKDLHKGPVFSLFTYDGGIISGGKDGKLLVLDSKMKPTSTIKCPGGVRSIDQIDDSTLIVGTKTSKIISVENYKDGDAAKINIHVSGHSDGEVWGLDAHPSQEVYVTAGEENQIYIWDSESHKLLAESIISDKQGKRKKRNRASTSSSKPGFKCARSVAFSPDGGNIALGTNDGNLEVFSVEEKSYEIKHLYTHDLNKFAKQKIKNKRGNWIQAVKYSPDGKTLSIATHGSVIVLCDVEDGYEPKGCLKAHNSAVTHMDWSEDGTSIQSNCRGYELLFHSVDSENLKSSKQNTSPSSLKDAQWNTQTCILGWGVQGIFDPSQDGTDVNCVDYSKKYNVLATGDDWGNVNLFRYPCVETGNDKHVKQGHSSHVMNVKFSVSSKYLYSVGGGDKTICQWKVV